MTNIRYLLFFLIAVSFFLEGVFISMPLVFALSVCCYVLFPDELTLVAAFIAGVTIDVLRMSQIGITPLALAVSFILINLYQRGFELKDFRVIIAIIFAFTFIYARVFDYSMNLLVYIAMFASIGGVIWLKQLKSARRSSKA